MSLIPTSVFSEPTNVYNLVAQDEGTCDGKLASSYFRQDFTLIEVVHPLFRWLLFVVMNLSFLAEKSESTEQSDRRAGELVQIYDVTCVVFKQLLIMWYTQK